ncbi:O-antigen ligase family protein [Porphyromonas sp.]|uniref:O-antigen ligase family protein n=1 Tax=Porphyromonas sp. TaxID=1924944 RepID=UPI003994E5BB
MREHTSLKKTSKFGAVIFIGSLFLYTLAYTLLAPLGESRLLDRGLLVLFVVVEIIGTALFYYTHNIRTYRSSKYVKRLVNSFVAFSLLSFGYAIVELAFGDVQKVSGNLPTIISVSLSLPASLYYLRDVNPRITGKILFWAFLPIYLYVFLNRLLQFRVLGGYSEDVFLHGNNVAYNFVILTPLALFAYKDKKWMGLLLLLLLSTLVFLCAKRGAILSQGLIILIFIFRGPYKFGRWGFAVLCIGGFLALMPIVSHIQNMEVSPLDRFEDTSGSGRSEIYSSIIDGVKQSSIGALLYGHGFYATVDLTKRSFGSSIGSVAHNDWLEIAYDFGLVGLILYLLILFFLLKAVIKSEKQESRFLLIILVIFLVRTNFSMVFADKGSIIYYTTVGLILLEDIRTHEEKTSTTTRVGCGCSGGRIF